MSTSKPKSLPPHVRAIICNEAGQPLTVEHIPTPQVVPGSVLVKIIAATVETPTIQILSGKAPGLNPPTPFVPGGKAIGRVNALGPDATSLHLGQLVMLEAHVRARDDPSVQMLWGASPGQNPLSNKLIKESWRNGAWAEYALLPLENCYALDEQVLLGRPSDGGFGYSIEDLTIISRHLVPYGGLRGIGLRAGETVIIAPATGGYSGAAVDVASAMGARVIAMGRNVQALQKLAAVNPRVNVVQLTNDPEKDMASLQRFGEIDAYLDISPTAAEGSTHVRTCLMALKPYGRASLMGVLSGDIPIPYVVAALKNITIRGQYMYQRQDARDIIKLVETGVLKLGKKAGHNVVGEFKLEETQKALDTALARAAAGSLVLFKP